MRRGHRRAHRRIWLFFLPVLLIAFTMALALRPPPAPPAGNSAATETPQ